MSVDSNENENYLAETESFAIIEVREPDGLYYDVEMGMVTVHLTEEEYEEFIDLIKQLKK